jgi:HK97 family phage major capsid protein
MHADDDVAHTLVAELRKAKTLIERGNTTLNERVDEIERSLNEVLIGQRRPGADSYTADDRELERKSALTMCHDRHSWQHQRNEGKWIEYRPSGDEIDEAVTAQRAIRAILRHGDFARLDHVEQKSLSSFVFGSSGWVVPPEMSSRILSCLTDETDFMSLLSQQTISSGSVQFPLDNSVLEGAGWACETACAGPPATIQPPGLLEVKAESLRAVVCSTTDLLQDASFNVEQWLLRKAARMMRQKLAQAFLFGDGMGKPLGLADARSGIPVADTGVATPPGSFTWQDLFALKYSLPEEYASRGVFLMNPNTLGLVVTMSDGMGRPIWMPTPATEGRVGGGFQIAGSPVRIVSQLPNAEPGSTPILFADLEQLYLVVIRRATSLQADPYSLSWCVQFRIDARIGGAVICPNAGRWLRIA